jgi:hypothetical protein
VLYSQFQLNDINKDSGAPVAKAARSEFSTPADLAAQVAKSDVTVFDIEKLKAFLLAEGLAPRTAQFVADAAQRALSPGYSTTT